MLCGSPLEGKMMTDLQTLVRQTSNPSILEMQQRLHGEVIELGKMALQWREGCEALQLALETEREAANLYAKQVAHWIEKHDALLAQYAELQNCVTKKYGGETLHQTMVRYLCNWEGAPSAPYNAELRGADRHQS
jgi:hypothetical protein